MGYPISSWSTIDLESFHELLVAIFLVSVVAIVFARNGMGLLMIQR
jgi:hypothetical protein